MDNLSIAMIVLITIGIVFVLVRGLLPRRLRLPVGLATVSLAFGLMGLVNQLVSPSPNASFIVLSVTILIAAPLVCVAQLQLQQKRAERAAADTSKVAAAATEQFIESETRNAE